jgi:hypothetical protein
MPSLPSITPLIESAFLLARAKYPAEHKAWTDLSWRLAGRVSLMPLSATLQRAGDLDLVLRAMEDEAVAAAQSAPPKQGLDFAFHYQRLFSEVWITENYEALRALRQREEEVSKAAKANDPDHVRDDVASLSSFKSAFADLELLRMPIAKFEIAKEQGKDGITAPLRFYRMPPNGDTTDELWYDRKDPSRGHIMPTGLSPRWSVTWLALDHRGPLEYWVERRDLADRILKLNDEVEPMGIREARLAAQT